MEARELRIGNFFLGDTSENNFQQITAIEILDFNNDPLDDYYKPIPLTEEWLLKFGFFSKYKSCYVRWNILGFDIQQKSDEDDNGNKIPQEQVFYFNYMYEIKYVHQLQNLYFALTQKELVYGS